jgi:molybdate transport system substrate-binding protein
MATRRCWPSSRHAYRAASGVEVVIESVGGVDAAKRVAAGEMFDVVILAADAIDKLIAGGSVLAGAAWIWCARRSPSPCARARRSPTSSARRPASRRARRRQRGLFDRSQRHRPACALRTLGHRRRSCAAAWSRRRPACRWRNWWPRAGVELGFQQLSEMLGAAGHRVVGGMPAGCEIVTTFSGGVCAASTPARGSARAARLAAIARHCRSGHHMPVRHGTRHRIGSLRSKSPAHDHRHPRPLHHRAQGAGRVAQPPDRRHQGSGRDAQGFRAEDQRRRTARIDRDQPAEEDAGARLRPHHLLAARQLHGPPHRRLQCQLDLGGDLQRAVPPRRATLPRQLHRRGHAAAVARRRSEDLRRRTGKVRQGIRLRRHQPQPDPSGGHWTSPPLTTGTGTRSTKRWWSTASRP